MSNVDKEFKRMKAEATEIMLGRESLAAPSIASSAPADELPQLPEPLEIYWPELHSQALGCGVEDRNIHDRYEAAEYGWQDGVDKTMECVPDAIYDADQMRAYAVAAIAAQQAAPAARLTDAKIRDIWCGLGGQERWLKDFGFIQFARAIEAAAAPNAALAEALKAMLAAQPNANDGRAGIFEKVTDEDVAACRLARAALASLPVPPKEAP